MDCRDFVRGCLLGAFKTLTDVKQFLTCLEPHERTAYLDTLENGVLS